MKPGSALVVVESPAKAKTINKYLGANYIVKASVGHVRDLPEVEDRRRPRERTFEPLYDVIEGKKKVVAEIRKAARRSRPSTSQPTLIAKARRSLAHREEIKDVNKNLHRVVINEITQQGVTEAIAKPRDIDMHMTDAQQARRILDRLVGYKISPILWRKVQRGLSAGRVQSVAVRMVCEREEEIEAFIARGVLVGRRHLRAAQPPPFDARIWKWKGEKAEPKTEDERRGDRERAAGGRRASSRRSRRRSGARSRRRRSSPRRLQQDAARKLGSPQSARWRSRSASTKVSSSATKARRASSPTCVPTRRVSPRR